MASIQKKGNAYYCQFLHGGKRHTVAIGKVGLPQAEAFAIRTEELLSLLARGRLSLPVGVEINEFVRKDGRVEAPAERLATADPIRFGIFKERYREAHQGGAMEANSLATALMHLGHFERTFGEKFPLQELSLINLQQHVQDRRKKKYRGRLLSPVTLKEETASLRAAWNWAVVSGLVEGDFPNKGLVYPKSDEKPPFMTRDEIDRRIKAGGEKGAEQAELWDCLYLRKEELPELLAHVAVAGGPAWFHPLVAMAAYTGARRSELLRMLVGDVDFDAGTILVREKKRSRKQRTTRRVSLTPALATTLKVCLAAHPGGKYLFCQSGSSTGVRNGAKRPATRAKAAENHPSKADSRAYGSVRRKRSWRLRGMRHTTTSAAQSRGASGKCSKATTC